MSKMRGRSYKNNPHVYFLRAFRFDEMTIAKQLLRAQNKSGQIASGVLQKSLMLISCARLKSGRN